MPFIEPHKNLGTILVGSSHTIVYRFSPDITIHSVQTSCGCSMASASNDKKEIEVLYTAQPVPFHFLKDNKFEYKTAKEIKVLFEATSNVAQMNEETLTFKAIVKMKV